MKNWKEFITTLLSGLGFKEYNIEIDEIGRHGSIFIYEEHERFKERIPSLIESINHLVCIIAQKDQESAVVFDINNYRKQREQLINQLARAAARKAVATKESISLPPMNSYERRLIHMELAAHPEVKTESEGMGRSRRVMVRIIQ